MEPGEAGGHALRRIVEKIFQGSAEIALARLVSGRTLEPDEVERMKAMLDEVVEEDSRGSGPGPSEGEDDDDLDDVGGRCGRPPRRLGPSRGAGAGEVEITTREEDEAASAGVILVTRKKE